MPTRTLTGHIMLKKAGLRLTIENINTALNRVIRETGATSLPSDIADILIDTQNHIRQLLSSNTDTLLGEDIINADRIAFQAEIIANHFKRTGSPAVINLGNRLSDQNKEAHELIAKLVPPHHTANKEMETLNISLKEAQEALETFIYDQRKAEAAAKRDYSDSEVRLADLSEKIIGLEKFVESKVAEVVEKYNQSAIEIQHKNEQFDKLLGHVSARTVAGDYEKSSATEKNLPTR